jgi:hypothetical protein
LCQAVPSIEKAGADLKKKLLEWRRS